MGHAVVVSVYEVRVAPDLRPTAFGTGRMTCGQADPHRSVREPRTPVSEMETNIPGLRESRAWGGPGDSGQLRVRD